MKTTHYRVDSFDSGYWREGTAYDTLAEATARYKERSHTYPVPHRIQEVTTTERTVLSSSKKEA